MKITKSELREMIREALREELSGSAIVESGTLDGGYAAGGHVIDRYARPGASMQPSKTTYLRRLKSKNPDLVDIMIIKGKDIQPGMITQAGQVKKAEIRDHMSGVKKVYIMHTNGYDGYWGVDEDMEVMVDPTNKSKPYTDSYGALLAMGLQESLTEDNIFEGLF
jgi:hypothetical protein